MRNTARYILFFFLYSFLGGLVETVFRFATEHHWYGVHGFLNIPILPIYGFGALLIIFIGRHFKHPILLFILGGLGAALLEFASSWIIEMLFGVKIWDYGNAPFSFQGRVRLSTAIGFSLCGVLLVYVVHPRVEKLVNRIPRRLMVTIATAIASVVVIDIVFSVIERLS